MLVKSKYIGICLIVTLMILGIVILISASEKVTIKVWYPDEFGVKPKYVDQAAEAFRKDFPNVNLEIARFKLPPGDFKTKLLLALASGEGPDVIHYSGESNIAEFADAGYIVPLDEYVNAWPDYTQYPNAVKDGVTYDGHVYAIPYGLDMRWLYYNKNIFKAVGLPVPWQPKSWNDIINAAIVIKERAPDKIPYILYAGVAGSGGTLSHGFLPLFYGAGGQLYNYNTGKWIVNSSAYRKTLEHYRQAYLDYKLVPQEVMTLPKPWTTMRQKMFTGELGILCEGGWVYGGAIYTLGLEETEKMAGYTIMPSEDGKFFFTIGGSGTVWYVCSQSKHPELAWEYIKRFNSKEIVAKICLETPHPVARIDSANLPEYKAQKYLVDCTKALEYAKFLPLQSELNQVAYRIQLLTSRVASGETSIEEAMGKYVNEMKLDLGEDKVEITE